MLPQGGLFLLDQLNDIQMFTIKDVCRICKVHPNTIRKYIKNGDLSAIKLGKSYIVTKECFNVFLNKKRTA